MQTINKLNDIVNQVVQETLADFADKKVQTTDLAISLIDLTKQTNPNGKSLENKTANDKTHTPGETSEQLEQWAHYRGDEPIYPASVVKLFYLVATHEWLEKKKIADTDELKRACKDMIVDSSNDATNYVIDVLTDTTSGPELSVAEMAIWSERRNAINKFFKEQYFTEKYLKELHFKEHSKEHSYQNINVNNINVNQKVWGDGSYGRERIFVGQNFENRNKLTTNVTAILLAQIASLQCVSPQRSKAMLELLARDYTKASDDIDNQATGFMGSCLPKNAKLWSKAGWMNTARHDAAYIELPSGVHFVLVVFISNHAKEYWLLPTIASKIIKALEIYHHD